MEDTVYKILNTLGTKYDIAVGEKTNNSDLSYNFSLNIDKARVEKYGHVVVNIGYVSPLEEPLPEFCMYVYSHILNKNTLCTFYRKQKLGKWVNRLKKLEKRKKKK